MGFIQTQFGAIEKDKIPKTIYMVGPYQMSRVTTVTTPVTHL